MFLQRFLTCTPPRWNKREGTSSWKMQRTRQKQPPSATQRSRLTHEVSPHFPGKPSELRVLDVSHARLPIAKLADHDGAGVIFAHATLSEQPVIWLVIEQVGNAPAGREPSVKGQTGFQATWQDMFKQQGAGYKKGVHSFFLWTWSTTKLDLHMGLSQNVLDLPNQKCVSYDYNIFNPWRNWCTLKVTPACSSQWHRATAWRRSRPARSIVCLLSHSIFCRASALRLSATRFLRLLLLALCWVSAYISRNPQVFHPPCRSLMCPRFFSSTQHSVAPLRSFNRLERNVSLAKVFDLFFACCNELLPCTYTLKPHTKEQLHSHGVPCSSGVHGESGSDQVSLLPSKMLDFIFVNCGETPVEVTFRARCNVSSLTNSVSAPFPPFSEPFSPIWPPCFDQFVPLPPSPPMYVCAVQLGPSPAPHPPRTQVALQWCPWACCSRFITINLRGFPSVDDCDFVDADVLHCDEQAKHPVTETERHQAHDREGRLLVVCNFAQPDVESVRLVNEVPEDVVKVLHILGAGALMPRTSVKGIGTTRKMCRAVNTRTMRFSMHCLLSTGCDESSHTEGPPEPKRHPRENTWTTVQSEQMLLRLHRLAQRRECLPRWSPQSVLRGQSFLVGRVPLIVSLAWSSAKLQILVIPAQAEPPSAARHRTWNSVTDCGVFFFLSDACPSCPQVSLCSSVCGCFTVDLWQPSALPWTGWPETTPNVGSAN